MLRSKSEPLAAALGVICSGASARRMASKFAVALPAETISATSLGAGEQRPMDDLRIDAYGVIDEANSAIGLARVATVTDPDCAKLDAMLLCVQNDLFDLGADLFMLELNAKPDPEPLLAKQPWRRPRLVSDRIAALRKRLPRPSSG